jgi:hypothetical protein
MVAMLKTALDVAPEPFSFAPVLIILALAAVALILALFLVRFLRKTRG